MLWFNFLLQNTSHFAFLGFKQRNTQHLCPKHTLLAGNDKEQEPEEPTQLPTHTPTKSVGQTHRAVSHQQCVCSSLYYFSPTRKCETKLAEVNTCIALWVYQEHCRFLCVHLTKWKLVNKFWYWQNFVWRQLLQNPFGSKRSKQTGLIILVNSVLQLPWILP